MAEPKSIPSVSQSESPCHRGTKPDASGLSARATSTRRALQQSPAATWMRTRQSASFTEPLNTQPQQCQHPIRAFTDDIARAVGLEDARIPRSCGPSTKWTIAIGAAGELDAASIRKITGSASTRTPETP